LRRKVRAVLSSLCAGIVARPIGLWVATRRTIHEVAADGTVARQIAAPEGFRLVEQDKKLRRKRQQRADRFPFGCAFLAFFRGFAMAAGAFASVLQELVANERQVWPVLLSMGAKGRRGVESGRRDRISSVIEIRGN